MRLARAIGLVLVVGILLVGGSLTTEAAEEAEAHGSGWDLLYRVVNFAILVGALVYLLRKPLSNYLDAKTEQIRRDLTEAAGKRERAEAERKEAEARLAGLDREIAEARVKGLAQAEDERRRILQAAESEAARLAENAKKEIEAELELARRKLTARAAELSIEMARKKIREQISDADRRALFEKSMDKLGEAR
ncbi:MAG TPA: ATP synthase F0 subunit B [Vicinamibacteria bacterium]|nr:ATP synthase F0 subunit B [Vicinamibacteria bacterium]